MEEQKPLRTKTDSGQTQINLSAKIDLGVGQDDRPPSKEADGKKSRRVNLRG